MDMENLKKIIKNLLVEHYESERLYDRSSIVKQLSKAPSYMKKHMKNLPHIPCKDKEGNEKTCTKLPEVVFNYLFRNF